MRPTCPSCNSDDIQIGRTHFICRQCPEIWPLVGGQPTRRREHEPRTLTLMDPRLRLVMRSAVVKVRR